MKKRKENIPPEYKDDISRAIVDGILKGYKDRIIRPTEPVSRIDGYACKMCSRSRRVTQNSEDMMWNFLFRNY